MQTLEQVLNEKEQVLNENRQLEDKNRQLEAQIRAFGDHLDEHSLGLGRAEKIMSEMKESLEMLKVQAQ